MSSKKSFTSKGDPPPFVAMPYPGLLRVTHEVPFPGLRHVHTYLARGPQEGFVLIDTSLGYADSLDRFELCLKWLGASWDAIESIILTHCHPDHIGLAASIQELSGAPVVCHQLVATGFAAMQTPDRYNAINAEFSRHGLSEENAMPHWSASSPSHFELVTEGSSVRFADANWEVAATPGHEAGHIALHSDGILVSGDTLLGKITPHVGLYINPPDPLGQFLDSLDRLSSLNPLFVLPGHGRSFENGAERARATMHHHLQRLANVRELLNRGPLTAQEISQELFGRELRFFLERLALAESLAHLEYLRLRGTIERRVESGLYHYFS